MNVIQRPPALVFAADCPDYIIDTDNTITFEIRLNGTVILSEEYSPDLAYQVRIRKLGRFLAKALWGDWASGTSSFMDHLWGDFQFYIGGSLDATCRVIYSRGVSKFDISPTRPLSSVLARVVRPDTPDYTSFYLASGEQLQISYTDAGGLLKNKMFFQNPGQNTVVSLDTSYSRAKSIIGADVDRYKIGDMTYHVDRTSYVDKYVFRFKNNYDCTEVVVATGSLIQKTNDNGEQAFMHGIERKFVVRRQDTFTVNSGVIFMQSDYRLWSDIINSQQVSILVDGSFYDIIITGSNYERDYRKNLLKAVEFSFRFADPDNNGIL